MIGISVRWRAVFDPRRRECGAALAEFALISALLVMLLFAVLQVAVFFYVHNIVAASAAEGARYGASAGVADADGAVRATELVARGLNSGVAADVPCAESADIDADSGLQVVSVRCVGHIRSMFLPIGSMLAIDVTSRSLKEGR